MTDSHHRRNQAVSTLRFCAALALMVIMVTGCGKRATQVDPPDNVTDDKFPLVYPDPSTDPGYVAKPDHSSK